MSKFITGKALEDRITDIIWKAEKKLLIVSPFIKLDSYFKKLFERHVTRPDIHLVIVFGKNEGFIQKSLNREDFEYFKQFPNVSIIYAANLHAKYYGNESCGVITSVNLYDTSFKKNIEFGVYSEQSVLSNLSNNFDADAWNESMHIAANAEVVFIRRPVYEKRLLLANRFIESKTLEDRTGKFYGFSPSGVGKLDKKLDDYPEFLVLDSKSTNEKPTRESIEEKTQKWGFCIRTGEKIPFNVNKPMSYEAYTIWAQWGDIDYKESYCHKTGKLSNGKTSMRNPVL